MTDTTDPAYLPVGKLAADTLRAMLAKLPQDDPRVIVGPSLGEDAAVLEMGGRCLVAATDPVTMASDRIGWYAVHVNANDVAVMGARPRWFFPVLLLPQHAATDTMVAAIMDEIVTACRALDITVCGGHTEVAAGLDRPVVVGQMLGEAAPDALVRKSQLQVGDHILLTRGVAIEGTAILAREKRDRLTGRVPGEVLARARALLTDPGISVVADALAAAEAGGVHAMHDPTEGGVLTGLAELAAASGLGLRVSGDRIPVLAETTAICRALAIDPLGLIASGALLIGAPPDRCRAIAAVLSRRGTRATNIGEVREASSGVTIETGGVQRPLVAPAKDELARVLDD